MPWVPEDQRTTVWYLLEPKFLVRVPQMALRTVDDIKLFGTPTSGDNYMDRELAKNDATVMLSIAAMEEIFHRGFNIKVVQYDDTKKIYEHISNHLIAFKNLLLSSENVNPEPSFLDELIRLDKFAQATYDKAKYVLGGDIVHSLLSRRFKATGFTKLSRSSVLASTPKRDESTPAATGSRDYGTSIPHQQPEVPVGEVPEADDPYPKRISLENMFERQKRLGATRWK